MSWFCSSSGAIWSNLQLLLALLWFLQHVLQQLFALVRATGIDVAAPWASLDPEPSLTVLEILNKKET